MIFIINIMGKTTDGILDIELPLTLFLQKYSLGLIDNI